jgi:hypothetical protein
MVIVLFEEEKILSISADIAGIERRSNVKCPLTEAGARISHLLLEKILILPLNRRRRLAINILSKFVAICDMALMSV